MFPSLLLVDDEPSILKSLGGLLKDEGYEVLTASNGYEALKIAETQSPDLVLLDVWMPGMDGIETLKMLKQDHPYLPVVIITGHGNIETAVQATKLGAYDLIEKPLSFDKVVVTINNALNFRRLEEENRYLRKKTLEKHSIEGNSPPIQELRKKIAAAAPTDSWILITGENGTGKELVARTVFQLSNRVEQPFIDVNCAALPANHIENELFGFEKNAFPEANYRKRGKFEIANNGTLFLDEIGDMSLSTQARILRVLQEQQLQRLGGGRTISVNIRVIASTNKDLKKEIAEGRFREDLYHRINVIPLHVPSLRERTEDIPILINTFLREAARQAREKPKRISREAVTVLCAHHWPGNVRELKNLIERLSIGVDADQIEISDLPASYARSESPQTMPEEPRDFLSFNDFKEARKAFEVYFLHHKLTENDHNISKTARSIGVGRSYLHKILKHPPGKK
ncbi:MAG: sigma-54-dependent transcriptional regulator [Desulfobacterales bacterium]